MSAIAILNDLRRRGVRLRATSGRLHVDDPKGIMTAALRAELAVHENELLELLAESTWESLATPSLVPVSRDGDFPLSFAQERLWFLDQMGVGSAYNISVTQRFEGQLDGGAFERTLHEIVRRHEILRTSFPVVDGQPVQRIAETTDVPFSTIDLSNLDTEAASTELARRRHEESLRSFDLARGPLLRWQLLRMGDGDHVLLLTMHHIVSDGWSMGVLNREFAVLYGGQIEGRPVSLPELPVQYADYTCWQRSRLQSESLERELSYWRQRLGDGPPPLDLPTDRPRPRSPSYRGDAVTVELPAQVLESLRALSRSENATLFMVLVAAFKVLLMRYSSQEDILIGMPIAGRHHRKVEGLIGCFLNTLVLRTDLSGSPSFREVLRRVRRGALEAYGHQDIPFEKLLEELQPERDLSRSPLFQVFCNMVDLSALRLELPGLKVQSVDQSVETEKFDLTLYLYEIDHRLEVQLNYSTDLFDRPTIELMLGNYGTLLEAVTKDAGCPVGRLPLLSPEKRRRFAGARNHVSPATAHARFPAEETEQTIAERFVTQVARTPHRLAVKTRDEEWTYGQLDAISNRVGWALREQVGTGHGHRIALLFDTRAPMLAGLLGTLRCGQAYVPLDPTYPEARLRLMLDDARVRAIVTERRYLEQARALAGGRMAVVEVESLGGSPRDPVPSSAGPDSLAYILYTSGTGGRPKGVMQSHRNVLGHVRAYTNALRIVPEDRLTVMSSHTFDGAVMDLYGALLNGATLLPTSIREESLGEVIGWLEEQKVTIYHSTPSVYRFIAGGLEAGQRLVTVRAVVLGGEEARGEDVALFRAHFGQSCVLVNGLGPSESTLALQYFMASDSAFEKLRVPVGYPVEGTRVVLLDSAGEPTDVVGEIGIESRYVALGYWGLPVETASSFGPSISGSEHARLYRTGDLGRLRADGTLEFLGRLDHQVKVRGYRIEPGEIESVVLEHPEIRQAVAVVREDAPGDRRLMAYVVAEEGQSPSDSDLRRLLKERLPEYMVPSAIVMLEAMPLTPNGKVDRSALPAPSHPRTRAGYVAPRNGTEEVLCSIWAELLSVEQVGVYDNFFELGGHSLLATRLVSRIRRTLERELALREIFEHPTVAELAARLAEVAGEMEIPPLVPVAREGELPLSFAQERLWFLDQLEAGSAYHMPLALRLRGELDETSLRRSLEALIERHETLRTSFPSMENGIPVQRIAEAIELPLRQIDLSALASGEREREARRVVEEDVRQAFDLSRGPLARWLLVRLAETEHALVMTMHHIVSDGWSIGVLLRDWTALYEAIYRGEPSPLAEPAVQYGDYTIWQREWLTGEVLDSQLAYWREQLADVPVLELPADGPRPAVQTFQGDVQAFAVAPEISAGLRQLCREEGVTLAMVLLGAWQVLLGRYAGQEDVAVGMPIANRRDGELEGLIGFFVNTLVLRTEIGGDPTFREFLSRVREVSLSAYAHQDVPFEQVVDELNPQRDLSRHPLFQVSFAMQNAPREALRLGDLEIDRLPLQTTRTRFDLELHFSEHADRLVGRLVYNADLFEASTVERMTDRLVRLLEGVASDPSRRVSDVSLLSEEERHQLLVEWNDTAATYPDDRCIHELFEEQVERTPDAVAVAFGEESLTYGQLNSRANQLAHTLRDMGVGVEDLVGLCVERSFEMVVGLLGILKAGGAYVPLDPEYPRQRLKFMLEDSGVSVLLTQASLLEALPDRPIEVLSMDRDASAIGRARSTNPSRLATAANLAYVIYTSGSTGRPKAVLLAHRGLCNVSKEQTRAFCVEPTSRILQFASISFDAATFEIVMALANGAALLLGSRETLLPGPDLLRFLRRHAITIVTLPPSALGALPVEPLSDLKTITVAGEACSAELVSRWAPGRRFFNLYGPTEATIWSTIAELRPTAGGPYLGRPIGNTRAHVLDDRMGLVPVGVPGELCIGGVGLGRGYHHRPDLTAERFMPDPYATERGERLYRTGDLARYRADGNIEFLGRADHQVKVRGYRIELGEVESVLLEHPGVRQAVVVAREGARDTPSIKRLVAYVVAEEGGSPGQAELRGFLTERLPDYMVPSAIEMLETLPMTASGKVDRTALPAPSRALTSTGYVAARNGTEEVLCSIWSELLGVERVGVHDNFFELGGHSLLATQLVSRIRRTLERELALREIFENPTVAKLAESLAETSSRIEIPALVPVARERNLPLSFAQERLWFLDQLEAGPAYHMPLALRLRGELDEPSLRWALEALIDRHETLRTSFPSLEDGRPVQRIAEAIELPLRRIDLSELASGEREQEARRVVEEEVRRAFDLSRGPLVRWLLVRLSEAEHVLVMTMHHIVSDGWSMGVLLREWTVLYEASCRGEPSPLAELVVQYGDYTIWQREWLSGEVLDAQLSYWRGQLADVPMLELPADRPRPAIQTFEGGLHAFVLAPEVSAGLRRLCREEGVTPAMVLLGAWQVLLGRYAGQDDVAVGMPIANRRDVGLEGLIGFFVNTLVLRTDLGGAPTFRELLARVREVSLSAYAHQDVPFEQVVEALNPERALSHHPLFQVTFAMQNAPREALRLGGLEVERFGLQGFATRFDLELHLTEAGPDVVGQLIYNVALFEEATVERMAGHLVRLLEVVASDPSRRVSELSPLGEGERHQFLVEWNDTAAAYPDDKCIHELFEEQVERAPNAVAAVFGDESLTYGELNKQANQLAHTLRDMGVGVEDLVGLCVERSLSMVVGLLGILKAGGAYVPLDPEYPRQRLGFMLEDSGVSVLLTQASLLETLPDRSIEVLCVDRDASAIGHTSSTNPLPLATPDNLAYVIYTSGSTGRPKAVLLAHRGLCNVSKEQTRAFCVEPTSRILQFASISFDAATFEIVMALANGAALLLGSRETLLPGPDLLRFLRRHAITIVTLPPSAVGALPVEPLSDLKTITVAGEACSAELVSRWAPGRRFFNLYGPTEATIWSTIAELRPTADGPHIGRPIGNTRAHVLDDRMGLVPVGVPGELCIGGVGLGRGYHHRPDLTAERFMPDPYATEPGERLYRTGDRARYRADGNIEFLGRADHQVKVRGYRIELGEVESVLLEHPGVRQVVVVAREGAHGTPSIKRLVAYVVAEEGGSPGQVELRGFLTERLPDYMVPSAIEMLETLPMTASGKVDRTALPAPSRALTSTGYVAARNGTEEVLCSIWSELLGVERVGVHDNFFDVGGDSILSIQVVARAKRAGIELTPRQMFQHQTIAELAEVAGAGVEMEAPQRPLTGSVPLLPVQRWLFEQDVVQPEHFNQAVLLGMRRSVAAEDLGPVLEAILERHDALRSRFVEVEPGVWEQRIAEPGGEVPLSVMDPGGLPADERPAWIERHAEEVQSGFDLAEGSLFRAVLFGGGDGESDRLLLVAHHLVIDGVSWRVLLEDLERGLSQRRRGEEVDLGAKTSSIRQWSERLLEYGGTPELREAARYWQGLPWSEARPLPVDDASGSNMVGSSSSVTVTLSEDETRALLQDVPRAYHTQINDVMLTAMWRALSDWTGSSRVVLTVEGHGREDVFEGIDLSQTVGWFTSIFPVVLEVSGGWDPGEALRSIKEQLRSVPHRGLDYGVARYLSGDEELRDSLSGLSRSEVSFNYLGQFGAVSSARSGESWWVPVSESAGSPQGPRNVRRHVLDVGGMVSGGELVLQWTYSRNIHRRQTIERVASRFLDCLRELIDHGCSQDVSRYTPSDFPRAGLDRRGLDGLVESVRGVAGPETRDLRLASVYPLSPMQSGMVYHTLSAPGTSVYVVQFELELSGELDVESLRLAWCHAMDRHPSLRTLLVVDRGEAMLQVVVREAPLPWREEDLRGFGEAEQASRIASYLEEDRNRGFDLQRAPLFRLMLFRTGQARHRMVWTVHHAVIDGWSSPVLLNEVLAGYENLRAGEAPRMGAAPPYEKYIDWLGTQDKQEAESYWRAVLRGLSGPTSLLWDARPESRADRAHGTETVSCRVPEEVTRSLASLARTHRLTLNTVVQGAWTALLSRYSGETDVVYGVTDSGRPPSIAGIEGMVGCLVRTLPCRVEVDGSRTVHVWLRDLQSAQVERQEHGSVSLVELQGWSEVAPGTPLFETLFVYENYPTVRQPEDSNLLRARRTGGSDSTNYALSLVCGEQRGELHCRLMYDPSWLARSTVERMAGHLGRLLAGIAEDPSRRLGDLPLLSEAERHEIVESWNETARAYPSNRCVHELFEDQAARAPQAIAVSCGEERLTYGELNARSNRLAHQLRSLGVGPDALVGLCVERSIEMLVGVFGILKAGGAYVPLDATHPTQRLVFTARDSGIRILLAQEVTLEMAPELAVHAAENGIAVASLDGDRDLRAGFPSEELRAGVSPSNRAYVMYTSGSTGRPKGVEVEHRSLVNLLASMVREPGLGPSDVLLAVTTLSFDIAALELFGPLMVGGSVVIASSESAGDPQQLRSLLRDEAITVMQATPATWQMLIDSGSEGQRGLTMLCGGEALPRALANRLLERGGDLWNLYGPTETTVWSSRCHVDRDTGPVTLGGPIGNTRLYVVDRGLRPVPVRVSGELSIAGDGLARGYLGRPDLTAERFVPDPFATDPGGRLYRTGDLVRFQSDGSIEFLGRLDHQVKVRGHRIELGEIESVLLEHPEIRQAVAVAREGSPGDKRLVAYVVAEENRSLDDSKLRDLLRERLPDYMVPASIVPLDELPRGPTGKVDRKALPASPRILADAGYVAARNGTEEVLCSIWAELLGVERVGVHDTFFELGGHSLLATQLVSRIRRTLERELPLREIFEHPTVARLAARLAEASSHIEIPPLVPVAREGDLPLSFAQERLWFLDQMEVGSIYNIPMALRLKGEVDIGALERTLREIVRRHESLRTSFPVVDGQPVQRIANSTEVPLATIDLSDLEIESVPAELERRVHDEAVRPFNLARGPLLRSQLLRLGDDDHVLVLTLHHIVSDAWSIGVLNRELAVLYAGHAEGRAVSLPELAVQYADYASWQRSWLQGEALAGDLSYWGRRLGDGPSPLDLPTDRPRPRSQSYRGDAVTMELPEEVLESLRTLSRSENATLFMVLVAAFKVLLMRYSSQEDILIGMPIAGRQHRELEGLIGCFLNTLVLRTDLSGSPSFREVLHRVRRGALEAYGHQDIPFEKLLEELQPERDLSRSPLFQVFCNMVDLSGSTLELPGLEVQSVGRAAETARFDLTLYLFELDERLVVRLNYSTDLFDRGTVELMLSNYGTLLRAVTEDAGRPVGRLPLLGPEQRRRLAVERNRVSPATAYERFAEGATEQTIAERFATQVARVPDHPAVKTRDQEWTYGDLDAVSNRVGWALREQLGRGSGHRVALLFGAGAPMVAGVLGTLRCGEAYVPLDPAYPEARLRFMLDDAGVRAIVTDSRHLEQARALAGDRVAVVEVESLQGPPRDAVPSAARPDSLAYLLYTSGTSGRPQGVMQSHRNVLGHVRAYTNALHLAPEDRLTLLSSYTFDGAVMDLYGALLNGATLLPASIREESLGELLGWLVEQQITVYHSTPSVYRFVLGGLEAGQRLETLRAVVLGGEEARGEDVALFREHLGPECVLVNGLGPSESTLALQYFMDAGTELERGRVPVGYPVEGTRVVLLDGAGEPTDVLGEIGIESRPVALGYWGLPVETASSFGPSISGSEHARLYRTGDLGRLRADGTIEFLGRLDEQVKVRGYRIEPGEIESVLLEHPEVRQTVAVAREDAPGDRSLVAYVVAEDGRSPRDSKLRGFLKERLPEYMVPSAIVRLEALPLTPNGKVDRKVLPAPDSRDRSGSYLAPRNGSEEVLCAIWGDVLGVDRVGVHDNFFELGGDSILSIQIVSRANQAGVELTPPMMFQHQTVSELADVSGVTTKPEVEQGPVTGSAPLLPIQQWFFERELDDRRHYNQAMLLTLSEEVSEVALRDVVARLLAHHDAVRSRYQRSASGWSQWITTPNDEAPLQVVDLTEAPATERSELIERYATEVQASFDLSTGPLFKVVLYACGEDETDRLLLVAHHLVVDGLSWRVLLEDLERGLRQYREGAAVVSPPKTHSARRWASRLIEYANASDLKESVQYWQDLPWPEVGGLPVDAAGGANTVGSSDSVVVSLSPEETRALFQEVPAAYNTQINDVLLTALGQSLSVWTGSSSVLVDLEGHGREQVFEDVDLSRTVGWFTSLFPLVLTVGDASDLGKTLKSIKEQLRQVPHRGVDYGVGRYLSDDDALRSVLSSLPGAEVSFNYLGQFTQLGSEGSLFRRASESAGPTSGERNIRAHLLDVIGIVSGDQLRVRWMYSRHIHRRESIEGVANRFVASLRTLIAHCREVEAAESTPSDFPKAKLDQWALDDLVAAVRLAAAPKGNALRIESIYPLSPMQEGLVYHTLASPGTGAYVVQFDLVLRGALEVETLREAWRHMVHRHSALRTLFVADRGSELLQVVVKDVELPWSEGDLRDRAEGEQHAQIASYLEADRRRGFDLQRAPLCRVKLFRLGAAEHRMVWTIHHGVKDGWSGPVLLNELFGVYEALRSGEAITLPASRPYEAYIGWVLAQDKKEAASYWSDRLRGFASPTALPWDERPSGRADMADGSTVVRFGISDKTAAALVTLARDHRLTMNTVVQGAWALLLSRYSGDRDVVYGVTHSGRPAALAGIERMVGCFVNTLPFRVDVDESSELLVWLGRLQSTAVEQREYEHASLLEIQEWSGVPRGTPLFETLFVYENYPVIRSGERSGSLQIGSAGGFESTNYALSLSCVEGSEGHRFKLMYDPSWLHRSTVERIAGHLVRVLEEMASDPTRRVSELSMLSEAERHQLLVERNDTAAAYPDDKCVHELFEEQVERTPDAVAVVFGDQTLTYEQLNERANQVAHTLRGMGVGVEDLVGLCVERSLEMVVGLLGILKAGGAYVPLDPGYPKSRLAYMMEDTRTPVLLTQEHLVPELPEHDVAVVRLDADRESIASESSENPGVRSGAENLAYVMYTSGSTGRPKGSCIVHRSVVRLVRETNFIDVGPEDVFLQFAPISFDASTLELWGSLLNGAKLVVYPPRTPSLEELGRAIESHGVTTLWLTGALFQQMADAQPGSFRKVRHLLAGGDALSAPHVRRVIEDLERDRVLINGYGPTENTTFTCCHVMGPGSRFERSVPIGRPIANTQVYILDRRMEPVPVGATGELYAGGDGLAREFLNDPELTAENLVPNPFGEEPGSRLYRTGDQVRYLPDGTIEFLGRIDFQVKVRGFRIELGEIETALLRHETIQVAVVLCREDEPGNKYLVAYVVVEGEENEESLREELRKFLRRSLPSHMAPTAFVFLESLPLNPNGKLDRRALPPPTAERQAEGAYVAPRSELEERIARIWWEILDVEQVGVRDNFFDLGGHSLLAMQVVSRVRDAFGIDLELESFFDGPTVTEMAEQIEVVRWARREPGDADAAIGDREEIEL